MIKTYQADPEIYISMVGRKILHIEMTEILDDKKLEGGLTFYLIDEKNVKTKVIIGYTELGEWLERVEIV